MLATFDTEYFIDQRARRPLARIVDGITTELTWPEIQLRYGRDGDGADVLFLVGPEPDFHWSDFVDVVTDAAGRFDVRLVVGLGAFPAPTPHTRPIRVIGTAPASSAHLLTSVGSVSGELEVPAGIGTALELGFAEVDMDIITLWARVPHYVASMPYPQAAAALDRRTRPDRGPHPGRRTICAPRPKRRVSAWTNSSRTTPSTPRWSNARRGGRRDRRHLTRRRVTERRRTRGRT